MDIKSVGNIQLNTEKKKKIGFLSKFKVPFKKVSK